MTIRHMCLTEKSPWLIGFIESIIKPACFDADIIVIAFKVIDTESSKKYKLKSQFLKSTFQTFDSFQHSSRIMILVSFESSQPDEMLKKVGYKTCNKHSPDKNL